MRTIGTEGSIDEFARMVSAGKPQCLAGLPDDRAMRPVFRPRRRCSRDRVAWLRRCEVQPHGLQHPAQHGPCNIEYRRLRNTPLQVSRRHARRARKGSNPTREKQGTSFRRLRQENFRLKTRQGAQRCRCDVSGRAPEAGNRYPATICPSTCFADRCDVADVQRGPSCPRTHSLLIRSSKCRT